MAWRTLEQWIFKTNDNRTVCTMHESFVSRDCMHHCLAIEVLSKCTMHNWIWKLKILHGQEISAQYTCTVFSQYLGYAIQTFHTESLSYNHKILHSLGTSNRTGLQNSLEQKIGLWYQWPCKVWMENLVYCTKMIWTLFILDSSISSKLFHTGRIQISNMHHQPCELGCMYHKTGTYYQIHLWSIVNTLRLLALPS